MFCIKDNYIHIIKKINYKTNYILKKNKIQKNKKKQKYVDYENLVFGDLSEYIHEHYFD